MNKALLISTALATILATCASVAGRGAQPAVERAARDYRITIYNRFRLERGQYNLRREAGDELLQAWRAAGSPEASRQDVVAWYQAAARAALSDRGQPLPPTPIIEPAAAQPSPPAPQEESYTAAAGAESVEAPAGASPTAGSAADRPENSLHQLSLDAPAPRAARPAASCRILSSMAKAVLRSVSTPN